MDATPSFRRPDAKCLLSIDGGGIRGIYALQILKRIEQIAEQYSGNPDIRLSQCFDYIGGTSTGGIIAAALALGMRAGEVEAFYLQQARHMFTPNTNWIKRFTSARYDSATLETELQEVFGATTTLGSPRLQTLLMLVMMNASTSSPWPLSSNPRALFNDIATCGAASNLHLPLWQLVRASAAAPFFFAPEAIEIAGRELLFFDGALTSFNNPAFKLFQMATLPEYKLGWPTGADKLLLVSVGTGLLPHSLAQTTAGSVNFLASLPAAIQSLMFSGTVEQDMLCRSFADVRAGDAIDGEVGSLRDASPIGGNALFSYARYNSDLSAGGLIASGFERYVASSFGIDAFSAIEPCIEIGSLAAREQVRAEHFGGFW
ncbi:MAG: patatin-like phospholipase family protein [Pseudomonadota bacterium]|nr:patatin-like phospholipase family protein [Pseudomonadota bacterium]